MKFNTLKNKLTMFDDDYFDDYYDELEDCYEGDEWDYDGFNY